MLSRTLTTTEEAQAAFNGMLRLCPNNKTWKWGTIISDRKRREITFVITHTNGAVERVTINDHIPGLTLDTIEYVVREFFTCPVMSNGKIPPSFKMVAWEPSQMLKKPNSDASLREIAEYIDISG